MKEVTLKITFPNDGDYYKFLDDFGCADEGEDVLIPYNCKIKLVES